MEFSDLLTKPVTVSAALLQTSAALTGLVVSENTQENPEDHTVSSTCLVLSTTEKYSHKSTMSLPCNKCVISCLQNIVDTDQIHTVFTLIVYTY